MGVRIAHVIMVGCNLGCSKETVRWEDEEWEEEYSKYDPGRKTKLGDMVWVYDGMSGKYFIVGEIIQYDHEGYNGLKYVEIEDLDITEQKQRVKEYIKERFNREDVEPKLIVFTHYT